MGRYVLRRLLWMPLVLLILVFVSFFLVRMAPGGPFASERALPPEILKNLEAKYGLDQPPLVQFGKYVAGAVQGDLGPSAKFKDRTVSEIIGKGIGPTATLGLSAAVLALALGLTAGVVAAVRQNSVFDYGSMSVAMLGMSVPNFVTGPMLVLLFAMHWKLVNVAGYGNEMTLWPLAGIAGLWLAWRLAENLRGGWRGL